MFYDLIKQYGIPARLRNLVAITLRETKRKVKVKGKLSGEFIV